MSRFSAPIAEQIWDMKYRFKTADDEPIDACVEESWRRVAKDLARVEAEPGIWEEKFYAALEAVSYTHLRAHETDSYLVCRLRDIFHPGVKFFDDIAAAL